MGGRRKLDDELRRLLLLSPVLDVMSAVDERADMGGQNLKHE
jgi:hypothetical protein